MAGPGPGTARHLPEESPRPSPTATFSGAKPKAQNPRPPTMATTLKSAGANAGMRNRDSALSIPIATAANDTMGRNGSMIRVSFTVMSVFPGTASNPSASARTIGSEKSTATRTKTDNRIPRNVNSRFASR